MRHRRLPTSAANSAVRNASRSLDAAVAELQLAGGLCGCISERQYDGHRSHGMVFSGLMPELPEFFATVLTRLCRDPGLACSTFTIFPQ